MCRSVSVIAEDFFHSGVWGEISQQSLEPAWPATTHALTVAHIDVVMGYGALLPRGRDCILLHRSQLWQPLKWLPHHHPGGLVIYERKPVDLPGNNEECLGLPAPLFPWLLEHLKFNPGISPFHKKVDTNTNDTIMLLKIYLRIHTGKFQNIYRKG